MKIGKGGEGVAGRCVPGRSPYYQALERAHEQVAASMQVQVQARAGNLDHCPVPAEREREWVREGDWERERGRERG